MPNWCENILTIDLTDNRDPKQYLQEFNNKFKGRPTNWGPQQHDLHGLSEKEIAIHLTEDAKQFNSLKDRHCFNALRPVPQNIIKAGYNNAGYNWCIDNWGTKWDIDPDAFSMQINEGTIIYWFDTAWNPPSILIEHISTEFPALVFDLLYHEPGMGFAGHLVVNDGLIFNDSVFESGDHDDYMEFLKVSFPNEHASILEMLEEEKSND